MFLNYQNMQKKLVVGLSNGTELFILNHSNTGLQRHPEGNLFPITVPAFLRTPSLKTRMPHIPPHTVRDKASIFVENFSGIISHYTVPNGLHGRRNRPRQVIIHNL